MNRKLRLVVTEECHNRCPLCCNNRFDLTQLKVVDRLDYDKIMITGGEPALFYDEVTELITSMANIVGLDRTKIYLYTAVPSSEAVYAMMFYLDGVVATPHNESDLKQFLALNEALLADRRVVSGMSLRLNIFPEVERIMPGDVDLSLWKIKKMRWIKDCPVPEGEDLRRIGTLFK